MSRASLALLGLTAVASAAPTYLPLSHFDLSRRDAGTDFVKCLDDAGLDPVVEADPDYEVDAAPFNLRLPYKPAALVYPNSADDVSAAVKCATANNVKVNPRSGGHSYAAFALGGEDGHLVVSLDNLREVSVDGDKASIGAGNRLGDVALGIWQQGDRAMAHGTCPYVGIGGHAGHGGFGLPSRAWGLLLDQVYELEVVTADGSIVTANEAENTDLFWAMRGASSSFGIATTFKTITHPAPKHNVWFTYTWNSLTAKQASDFMQAWQPFSASLNKDYGFQIHINPQAGTTPNFIVDGYLYTDADDAVDQVNAKMQELLDIYAIPADDVTVEDQTWIDQVVFLAGVTTPEELNTTTKPDTHDTFFADSIFVSETEYMTQAASDALMEYLWTTATEANSEVPWFLIWDLYGGPDSLITQIPDEATSFDGRDALYSIQFYGSSPNGQPPYPENGIPLIEGMVKAITDAQPETKFTGYANYVSSELSREEAHAFYYPDHTPKLEELMGKLNPNAVFDFPQGFLAA